MKILILILILLVGVVVGVAVLGPRSHEAVPAADAPEVTDAARHTDPRTTDPLKDSAAERRVDPVPTVTEPTPQDSSQTPFFARIVDAGGKPVEGAVIRLQRAKSDCTLACDPGHARRLGQALGTSDSGGEVALTLTSRLTREGAFVVAKGHAPAWFGFSADQTSARRALVVPLGSTARLRGRIDDESRTDVTGLRVQVRAEARRMVVVEGPRPASATAAVWWTFPQNDGSFELTDLPCGIPLEVELIDEKTVLLNEQLPLGLEPGETRELEWHIAARARLEGIARDVAGVPVEGLPVWLTPIERAHGVYFEPKQQIAYKTLTDRLGSFSFEDIDGGEYALGPGLDNVGAASKMAKVRNTSRGVFAAATMRVTVRAGQTRKGVVLKAVEGEYIQGHLRFPDGRGAPNVPVIARDRGNDGVMSARSGTDGSFRIGPLLPSSYQVHAGTFGNGLHAASKTVNVSSRNTQVILELHQTGSLTGKVVDSAGEPVAASLTLRLHRVEVGEHKTAADATGAFELGELVPGAYDIHAQTSDGRFGLVRGVEIEPGRPTEEVTVEVKPGATVTVAYDGERLTRSFFVYVDGARVSSATVAKGKHVRCAIPAGEVVVKEVTVDSGAPECLPAFLVGAEQRLAIEPATVGRLSFGKN